MGKKRKIDADTCIELLENIKKDTEDPLQQAMMLVLKGVSQDLACAATFINRSKLRRAIIAKRDGRDLGKTGRPTIFSPLMVIQMLEWLDIATDKKQRITFKEFQAKV